MKMSAPQSYATTMPTRGTRMKRMPSIKVPQIAPLQAVKLAAGGQPSNPADVWDEINSILHPFADGGEVEYGSGKFRPGMTVPNETGGVQPWSVGENYPMTVMRMGMPTGNDAFRGVYLHADDMMNSPTQMRRTYDEALRDAQWLKKLLKAGKLPRFGGGGMAGLAETIARNAKLRSAGATVDQLSRGPTGRRMGERFTADTWWRRDPEGRETSFGTEADDAYRRKLQDIHDMAIEMRKERQGYAAGGNVSIEEAARARKQGYLDHAAGFPHMAGGGSIAPTSFWESLLGRQGDAGSGLYGGDPRALHDDVTAGDDYAMMRATQPDKLRAQAMLDRADFMGQREDLIKRSMLRRGWGLPERAMQPEESGAMSDLVASMAYPGDWPLWAPRVMSLGKQAAMMGAGMLSGAGPSIEDANPEDGGGGDWRWSGSHGRSKYILDDLQRSMPRMPDAAAIRARAYPSKGMR